MIDFQSSVMVLIQNHRPCHSPLGAPALGGESRGEGEHRERHFLCCSFLGEPDYRGLKSAPIGWVHPLCVLSDSVAKSVFIRAHPWLKGRNCETNPISNASYYQSERYEDKPPKLIPWEDARQKFPSSKVFQAVPRHFSGKKDCLFFTGTRHSLASLLAPLYG